MENIRIVRIPVFLANSYLVIGEEKTVIVDTGDPGHSRVILRAMAENDVTPGNVSLIHITHGHIDHYGSVYELRNKIDAPVAIHRADLTYLVRGIQAPLYAATRMAALIKAVGQTMRVRKRYGFKPEVVLDDEMDLSAFGLEGKIVATPGHTLGSSSIVLPDGRALVGDLLVRKRLLRGRPIKPPFIHDEEKHQESLNLLRNEGVTTLYLGHGGPIHCQKA